MIDTWNPAKLNEKISGRDSWNPAILNEAVTDRDSWNPAILNESAGDTPIVFEATITATFPEGATCTATDGTTTLTADDNPMTFNIPNEGTWAVACVANGVTFSENVVITTNGQTETVDLTPVGSTYATTNSVPVLIACAGIGDSEITTIAGALADVDILTAILESENAIDYLVRSTTFASDVTADSVAMTGIGAINYDADTLLADSTWLAAICNSTYFESVLNVKVPTMTSSTTPSGEASSSSVYQAGFEAWRAFNGIIAGGSGSIWHSVAAATTWIQYAFPSDTDIDIKCIKIWDRDSSNVSGTYSVNFKRSSGGDTIKSFTYEPVNNGIHVIVVDTANSGNICRLEYTNPASPNNYSIIAELQFYGRQDVE